VDKIDIGRESLNHFLMLGKLQVVVTNDGVNPASIRGECLLDVLADPQGLFGFRFGDLRNAVKFIPACLSINHQSCTYNLNSRYAILVLRVRKIAVRISGVRYDD
jgi:hypothetical protein